MWLENTSVFKIYLKRTHKKETFCKMLRSCWWEQFKFCMSAGSVHLAPFIPCERTFRVHCRAHVDWIFSISPVVAGNASTVHSSSAAAQKLFSFQRGIAVNKLRRRSKIKSHPIGYPVNERCIHKLCLNTVLTVVFV